EVRVIGASGARVFRAPPCRVGTDPVRLSLRWALPGAGDWRVVAALGNRRGARAEAAVYAPFLYSAGYGERLPASDAAADLWWASSGWKIPPERPAPRREGRALRISLARNEAEAVQLVVRPKRELEGFVAEVAGPAVGPQGAKIPTEAIEILRERYVFVRRPTDRIGWAGEWPDPLPPLRGSLRLAPGRNQPLWIRVTAPRGIPAGEYLARIRLRARDWSRSAPLRIRVYDFDLPDRMTCSTAFGFSPGNVWRYQKLTDETLRRKVLKLYLDDFAAHHISPYDPAPLDPFRVRWPKRDKASGKPPTREDLTPSIDWSAWDRAMEEAIDRRGFNSFRLPIVGMGGGTFHSRREPSLLGYPETAPEYRIAFNAYCRQVQEHLRAKGWLDEAYVYWFDEPDPKDYAFVMNGFRKLKAAAPDLRRMLTEEVEPELIGGPNIWCPLTPRFDPAKAAERRKFGEQFWWYICTGPKAPYCGLFIDHPGTELRVWLWQTWKRRIDGILIWQTTYWTSSAAYPDPKRPQNPYEDPMSWVSGYSTPAGTKRPWGNGDGRFLYPPEAAADGRPEKPVVEGPVDSIRWEMLRDGIEDYEYCAILERLVREKAGRLSPTERDRFARLLDVPPEITSSLTSFTRDPAPIEQRRDRLAKAIERLRRL
ncbi:MAG: DUF4091 domain-containing protein, partial [Verrucomicrobia bacterium]|nr:DUF4091 domain-containing protein [Verrucomicrobiota bacterium]